MTLIPDGNGNYRNIISSQEIAPSMFNILFFMEGHGLRHFKKFSDQNSVFGNRIIVWKVDWEGSDMNQMGYFKPKEVINETINQTDNVTAAEEIESLGNISEEDLEANETINETDNLSTETINQTINETDLASNVSEQVEDNESIEENQSTTEKERLSPVNVSIE